jgi:hypothetical protein
MQNPNNKERVKTGLAYQLTLKGIQEAITDLETLSHEQITPGYQLTTAATLLRQAQELIHTPENLEQAIGVLEQARIIAFTNVLECKLASLFHMWNGWKIGWHGQQKVSSFWYAQLLPSLGPMVMVAVVYLDNATLVGFAAGVGNTGVKPTFITDVFSSDWHDPVHKVLQSLDLVETSQKISLDGITYCLRSVTDAASLQLEFHEPTSDSLIRLEYAIWTVLDALSQTTAHPHLSVYARRKRHRSGDKK